MTTTVLADEVAEIGSQTHVGDGGLVVAPFVDGEALQEDEALAVDDVFFQGEEEGFEFGEGEVGLVG